MRTNGVKTVARLAFCGLLLLLGVSGMGLAGQTGPEGPNAGSLKDGRPFIEPLDAYCESGCCWASCSGYPDCSVECSSSGCSATGGGESAKVTCDAT
jgi:hypothetical protein